MRINKIFIGISLVVLALTAGACASRKVVRTSTDTVTDLSGRWNDTDSRLVSKAMIDDMLGRPWIGKFLEKNIKQPVIIAGYVKNRSSEHIETQTFIKDIERSLLYSGRATVVASVRERDQTRGERKDQQDNANFETVKKLGQETGADFILIGSIVSLYDAIDNRSTITYQIDLELVNIENNQKVWIGTKKIKKAIKQRRLRP